MNEEIKDHHKRLIEMCIFFAYSYGQITEGAAMELMGINRLEFRQHWISYLKQNPDVASATGNDAYLKH